MKENSLTLLAATFIAAAADVVGDEIALQKADKLVEGVTVCDIT